MTVESVVATVFQIDKESVTEGSSRDTIEAWDSMGHLSLITALETEYKVQIAIADAMDMGSVRQIKEILRKYGVAFK